MLLLMSTSLLTLPLYFPNSLMSDHGAQSCMAVGLVTLGACSDDGDTEAPQVCFF